jgi:type II secretory pathway pseudopilin PulG
MTKEVFPGTCRGVCRGERLVNWTGAWRKHRYAAFTLIELIVVVGIITILAGLVLTTFDYARKKSARARAESEIAALSAALESYKADNGVYPSNSNTNALDARTSYDPSAYTNAIAYLTWILSPAEIVPQAPPPPAPDPYAGIRSTVQGWLGSGAIKEYFTAKDSVLSKPSTLAATTISVPNPANPNVQVSIPARVYTDPFGNSYGYSTIQATTQDPTKGYNPTFDLWSTAAVAPSPTPAPPATQQSLWIKNW